MESKVAVCMPEYFVRCKMKCPREATAADLGSSTRASRARDGIDARAVRVSVESYRMTSVNCRAMYVAIAGDTRWATRLTRKGL